MPLAWTERRKREATAGRPGLPVLRTAYLRLGPRQASLRLACASGRSVQRRLVRGGADGERGTFKSSCPCLHASRLSPEALDPEESPHLWRSGPMTLGNARPPVDPRRRPLRRRLATGLHRQVENPPVGRWMRTERSPVLSPVLGVDGEDGDDARPPRRSLVHQAAAVPGRRARRFHRRDRTRHGQSSPAPDPARFPGRRDLRH